MVSAAIAMSAPAPYALSIAVAWGPKVTQEIEGNSRAAAVSSAIPLHRPST